MGMTNMKDQLDRRTKVVLRHLPPSISQAMLVNQVDAVCFGRYNLVSFRPAKNSQKHHSCSRAYLDFMMPEDVIEFAEFFNGHLFVNEKGIQYKTVVEYAPSQRVSKQWSRKDCHEGSIFKDPEYLEFLEFLAKPIENLPSAEIQLEKREAERTGAGKETLIVTPLMDFVQQKRASKRGSRRLTCNGKPSRKAALSISSMLLMRHSEMRNSDKMYVLKDAAKNPTVRGKSNYVLVPESDDQLLSNKSIIMASSAGTELLLEGSGSGINYAGKKKVLFLRGKQREKFQQKVIKNIAGSISLKQNQQCEGNGRKMRSILQSKDARQSQSSGVYSDQHIQAPSTEKERWSQHVLLVSRDRNGASDCKVVDNDVRGFGGEKERRRSKDTLDHGVWAPRNRSDGSFPNDGPLSFSIQHTKSLLESPEGSLKHPIHHGSSHNVKDAGNLSVLSRGRHSKKGGISGYSSHEVFVPGLFMLMFFDRLQYILSPFLLSAKDLFLELQKQVWVQKSSSGS